MQTQLKTEVSLKLTQPNGEEFFDATMRWAKLPYEVVLDLQKAMLGQVQNLIALGETQAAAIKAEEAKAKGNA